MDKWLLNSSMGFFLFNGSPTLEFQFHKGLKQGDPLSLFFFILIMKSLHLSFNRILDGCYFKGISFNNSLLISHLFYANDAMFVGECNTSNINPIVYMLKCFHLASVLKINFSKSKLMGIGINCDEVEYAARRMGCSTFSPPFNYLGVKVGGTMSRINLWDNVTSKLSSKLSKWKFKTPSIGGRLTLIKSFSLLFRFTTCPFISSLWEF